MRTTMLGDLTVVAGVFAVFCGGILIAVSQPALMLPLGIAALVARG